MWLKDIKIGKSLAKIKDLVEEVGLSYSTSMLNANMVSTSSQAIHPKANFGCVCYFSEFTQMCVTFSLSTLTNT
jgi:hypothetical protein